MTNYFQTKIDLEGYKHLSIDRISVSCTSKTMYTIMDKKYRKTIFHPKIVTGRIVNNSCKIKENHDLEWKWERWDSNKNRRKVKNGREKKPAKPTVIIRRNNDEYNTVTQRTLSWVPFTTLFTLNINKATANYCKKNNIPYKLLDGYDNGFEYIDLNKDEHIQLITNLADLEKLKEDVFLPYLKELFGEYAKYFTYFNFCQIEVHYDQLFESKTKAKKALKLWALINHSYFGRNCKITVRASNYKFSYSYKGLQIKGYLKDKAIRFEITFNTKYMTEKVNGHSRVDRKDIISALEEADRLFKRLSELTKPVQSNQFIPNDEQLRELRKLKNSTKDIDILEMFIYFAFTEFKRKDLIEATGLSINQAKYRLQKFRWLLELRGKKWIFKVEFKELIMDVLDSIKKQVYSYTNALGDLKTEFTHINFIYEHIIEDILPPPNITFSP